MLHKTGWLVLLVHLPPSPVGLRVRVWRRLRAMGAVAIKPSASVLPDLPEQREHFEWLAQEIEKGGGQATLLVVDRIERLSPEELRGFFHAARAREYGEVMQKCRALVRRAQAANAGTRARLDAAARRLTDELRRIRAIDFFDAPAYRDLHRVMETLHALLREPGTPKVRVAAIEAKAYRGKRWVTRPRPHVDRVATAWLIRRFIDPKARFTFSAPASFPRGAIPFDAPGVEFGHHGADCTFETMLKRFRLSRPALTEIGEVVHDIDLGDGRFSRPEARGLDWALRGLLASNPDDHAVLAAGLQLFDGLYATLTGGRR